MEHFTDVYARIQKRKNEISKLEEEDKEWVLKFKRQMLELEYEWSLKILEMLEFDLRNELTALRQKIHAGFWK